MAETISSTGIYPMTSYQGGVTFKGSYDPWPHALADEEIALLRALAKRLVDTDLFHTLMKEMDMDADAAMATAFRGDAE